MQRTEAVLASLMPGPKHWISPSPSKPHPPKPKTYIQAEKQKYIIYATLLTIYEKCTYCVLKFFTCQTICHPARVHFGHCLHTCILCFPISSLLFFFNWTPEAFYEISSTIHNLIDVSVRIIFIFMIIWFLFVWLLFVCLFSDLFAWFTMQGQSKDLAQSCTAGWLQYCSPFCCSSHVRLGCEGCKLTEKWVNKELSATRREGFFTPFGLPTTRRRISDKILLVCRKYVLEKTPKS